MKRKYTKKPISVKDQVELLQSRGLAIPDKDRAERYLASIGYYRFSAYCIPFEIIHGEVHKFEESANFDEIISLYVFDRQLRCLFMEALERVEIHIRAQWVNSITFYTDDPFAHLNKSNFSDEDRYKDSLSLLKSDVQRSKKEVFVEHFSNTYIEALPPVWVCVNLMSFGELINWVNNTNDSRVLNDLSSSLGFCNELTFKSFAVALTELRNVCAHHARLWNRCFMKKPREVKKWGIPGYEKVFPIKSTNKIYTFALILALVLRSMSPKTTWPSRLAKLLKTRTNAQLGLMGFPTDWDANKVFD